MAGRDQLLKQAESDLTLGGRGSGPADLTVWEHAHRTLISAELIARLPEVAAKNPEMDVVRVAALYHDAGWIIQVKAGEVDRFRVRCRPTNDVQFELAAGMVEASLRKLVSPGVAQRAANAIRGLNDRACTLAETHIVSDADNLDQIGPLWLLQSVRRERTEGRTLNQVLDAWHRQQEYHYWEARIRDGIHFEPVRALAWSRLEALNPFMQALGRHLRAEDLSALVGPSAASDAERPQAAS